MNTRIRRSARQPASAARPQRAAGTRRGRGMPARITVISFTALLSGTGLLLAAGCSSPGTAASSAASGPGAGHAAAGAAPGALGVRRAEAAPASAGQAASVQAARLIPASQSIIKTASITARVRNAATAAATAVNDVTAAGGYTAAERAQTTGSATRRPTASLTLKVPVAAYPAALRQLSALGTHVSLSQQSTDVTEQVADVSSLVASGQDAIAQLRTLLKRAGSVGGLLQVQQQISSDESSLESLLAQQRALSRETTYATISVLLLGPRPHRAAAGRHASRHSFLSGLAAGWRGLRHATAWVLTALGLILPFAVVLAILAGLGHAGWRRLARRRAAGRQAAAGQAG